MLIFERQNFRFGRSESNVGSATVSVGPEIIIADWLLVCVSALFFGLRIYSKVLRKTSLWWDDHVLAAAWLCLILDAIVNTINIRLGFGKHRDTIKADHLKHINTLTHLSTTVMMLGAVWSKTSFGLTVLRLIRDRPKVRALVLVIIATMNSFIIFNVIAVWIQCGVDEHGNEDDELNCLSIKFTASSMMFAGIYSGLMDIVLAILPWWLIWDLHMQRKEKIGIGIAMSMGLLLIIWGAAEVATTICAASIPQLRVLAREVVIITHRRHEESTHGHQLQEQQHHMAEAKHIETSHDSGSGFGSGSRSGATAVDTPAAVPLQPRPSMTTGQETSSRFAPTSAAVTTDPRSNSSVSSYTGLLRGTSEVGVEVERTHNKSKKQEPERERDGHVHGRPYTHNVPRGTKGGFTNAGG
ncbi:hypothetical protein GE21DRAFT_10579 [Neurospora crassa]|uniref:Rhodopsin domain-containing protein n=1 Tax=Neurospora crassa (strain ATCC 24698 / 74-OR23-1A / CBS 708.71 / DSM 1257 / FGSC 987) TaxID=367110 RepID=Q7S4I5_NEUCR|nr:hypothetical protein NCU08165 [Neurospora crassa OR74A]EAA30421.2 hypothetical protein NCU08165 [Neurospora crassa OR74A]KHE80459.1 hypothetical protein GE21DRAFT_10579 [Neurospora crassa]|eukprot:XP_959657.2 hypothetical protein NCU08165 [Neurospora crassa OR74A]